MHFQDLLSYIFHRSFSKGSITLKIKGLEHFRYYIWSQISKHNPQLKNHMRFGGTYCTRSSSHKFCKKSAKSYMTVIDAHIARVLKTLNPKLQSARTILKQVNHLTMSYRREKENRNAENAFSQPTKELN